MRVRRCARRGTSKFLPDHFVNVALIVYRRAMLVIQQLHLENGSLISSEDSPPNFPAKNMCSKVFLPEDGIPSECEIRLRWVAVRSSRHLCVQGRRFDRNTLSLKHLSICEGPGFQQCRQRPSKHWSPDLAGKYRRRCLRCQWTLNGVELLSECDDAPRDHANTQKGENELSFHYRQESPLSEPIPPNCT